MKRGNSQAAKIVVGSFGEMHIGKLVQIHLEALNIGKYFFVGRGPEVLAAALSPYYKSSLIVIYIPLVLSETFTSEILEKLANQPNVFLLLPKTKITAQRLQEKRSYHISYAAESDRLDDIGIGPEWGCKTQGGHWGLYYKGIPFLSVLEAPGQVPEEKFGIYIICRDSEQDWSEEVKTCVSKLHPDARNWVVYAGKFPAKQILT